MKKSAMNKKTFAIVGMIVSICLVVLGIAVIAGCFCKPCEAIGAPDSYKSGYATFGGDYYTYSVNNTAVASYNAARCVTNLHEIANFLNKFGGLFTICIGLFGFCGFGIVFAGCKEELKMTTEKMKTTSEETETTEKTYETTKETETVTE